MINLNISLTSLAVILWSGMMVIAGSIWVLSSQVRRLSELLEEQVKAGEGADREARRAERRPGRELAGTNVLRMVERTTSRAN